MSSLFGLELPTPVNFIIAFVFVLLLIGAAAYCVRRFGTTNVDAAARGRQPRLAVVDSAAVDGRRKLVIIRRDNVEHLLMIGGPSDVVVETNIVRGTAVATRDATPGRTETTAPRMPSGDPTPWPLQPEPVSAQVSQLIRNPRAAADEIWDAPAESLAPPPPAPEVRPVRPADTLAGLADELAQPAAGRNGQVQPLRAAPAPQPASAPQASPAMDQSLAEMAQRLEAALRRPGGGKVVTETQRVTATLDVKAIAPKGSAQPKPQPSPPSGNLEQEMASLLSRPGKI
jgi:flagellar biogenesis protein FliO